MYTEYYLTLPGGFQLPVAIAEETWYTYDMSVISVSEKSARNSMEQFAGAYLLSQMVGGQIISGEAELLQEQDVYVLQGEYQCMEMIGRIHSEEIITGNGKDH